MNTQKILQYVSLSLSLIGICHAQVRVSGVVRDDVGNSISNATVQIHEIVQLRSRDSLQSLSDKITPSPVPFTATAVTDSSGAYTIENVVSGTYSVCAYAATPRLLSNCSWTSHYASFAVAATSVDVPPLILRSGNIATIELSDPDEALSNSSVPNIAGPQPKGHRFFVGVIGATGYYSAAYMVGQSPGARTYAVTIPKGSTVNLFIDSDLSVSDSIGNAVSTRTPSTVVINASADATLSLTVRK